MATVYKRRELRAIPDGATIGTYRGKPYATWTDAKSKARRAPVNAAGNRIIVLAECYTAQYFNENGKRRKAPTGCHDKAEAERYANRLESEARKRRNGDIDPTLERFGKQAQRPLVDHIEDYRRYLGAKGGTPKHVESTVRYIEVIAQRCNAQQLNELDGAAVLQAVAELRTKGVSERTKDGAGPRTANAYLVAIKGFSRWLWRERRTPVDPLATLPRFNEETDRRHVRRELTVDELVYLLAFVEGHTTKFHNMPGPDRATAYKLALGTGFRAGELRSLTPASFDLDADPPTVTVAAAYSKRRRQDVQPIRPELAELLRPWLANYGRDSRPLAAMPDNAARMLQQDMAAARRRWLKESKTDAERAERERSDFLTYQDADGRVVDFHGATRHGYISAIVAGGASVKTCQELARHSTPTLTIGLYAHARLHDLTAALDALPDLTTPPKISKTPQAMAATGTDGLIETESCGQMRGGRVRKPEAEEFGRNWYCKTVAQLRNSWRSKQPKSEGAQQWVHHGTRRSRNSSPQSALSPRFC